MITLDNDNIRTALCCISGISPGATPSIIKEAESALLSWENSNPSTYAIHLLQVILTTTTTQQQQQQQQQNDTVPRLAAALSLKAMVGRKWKDRGRKSKKIPLVLLDDETKNQIRNILLSMLTTGGAGSSAGNVGMDSIGSATSNVMIGNYIQDKNLSISLIRDKTLMTTIASTLSKIANYDLPLEFKELVPTLIGYSIGSSTNQPIDPSATVETRFNTANALEFVLADICSKRLLLYKKYIISLSTLYLADIVTNGLSYSMDHLNQVQDRNQLPIILDYAVIMTKITHHLILSSLSSLVDGGTKNQSLKKGSNDHNNDHNNNNATTANVSAKAVDRVFELLLGYIPLSCNHLREMRKVQLTEQGQVENNSNDIDDKLQMLLGEFYRIVVTSQKVHPIAFSRFLSPFLNLFYTDLEKMGKNNNSKEIESLLFAIIPQMTFLANVISCSHYQPDEALNESMETWRSEVANNSNSRDGNGNVRRAISSQGDVSIDPLSVNNAVQNVWTIFLTMERINVLVDTSLFFMMLKDSHLTEWSDDPELFHIERKNAVSDDDIISCAQNMYLSLLESKCQSIVLKKVSSFLLRIDDQLQAAYFESGKQEINANDYSTAVFWDAVYTMIGLSLDSLKQDIGLDINNWFISCVSHVLKTLLEPQPSQHPSGRLPILRYRILWLIECGVSHLQQSQFAIEILNNILIDHSSAQNDAAVKLTAVQALSTITYDPPENFTSYLHQPDALIASLYKMASELEELESKTESLALVQLLLTTFLYTGQQIDDTTMINNMVKPLEQLWTSSVEQYAMLRSSVISILGCFAAFGKTHAAKLHPIALPLLNHALDPSNDDNSFLVADSLNLWLTLLRLAVTYDSNFSVVFGRTKELLQLDLEHVKKLMMITEGYILLGGQTFWENHCSSLEIILKLVVGNVSAKGAMYVNLVFEALLKTHPIEGTSMLLSSGLVTTMLQSCAQSYNNERHCEPIQVISMYLTVFSRIILAVPNKVALIVNHVEKCNNFGFVQLIDSYFQQIHQSDPLRQKLWTILLVTLVFGSNSQSIYDRNILSSLNFNKVLSCCLMVLQQDVDFLTPYSVEYDSEEETLNLPQDNYEYLMNVASTKDIVYTMDFSIFYVDSIKALKGSIDGELFRHLLQSIDQNLKSQLNREKDFIELF